MTDEKRPWATKRAMAIRDVETKGARAWEAGLQAARAEETAITLRRLAVKAEKEATLAEEVLINLPD